MNYAVVIGINDYLKRPLKGAVADATEFSNWLIQNNHVTAANLKLLVSASSNQVAATHDIDKAFVSILNDAEAHREEKNRLYFYFSGHGIGVSYTNTGLCLRFWDNDLPNYNISTREYQDTLVNKAIFDEILIFLDCCRDYDFLIEPHKPSLDRTRIGERQTSVLTCYSTAYGKLSYEIQKEINGEDSNNKRGAFTSFLLEGLKGDADVDGDGFITGDDLVNHISANFKTYALKYNKEQAAEATVSNNGNKINICSVAKTTAKHNYTITFKRQSNISIFDGGNNPVANATGINVVIGQELKLVLPKGLIKMVDNTTKEEKYFTNYNPDTESHEQF